jgi:hypothetical protein
MSFGQFTPMKAAAISKVGQDPESAGQWSVRQQENEALAVPPALLEIKRIGIFNEIDKQLLILSHAAAALIDTQAYPVVTKSDAAPGVREFAVPSQNGR